MTTPAPASPRIDLDHLDEIAKNVTQGPLRVDAPRCNSVQVFTPNDLEHPGVKHWIATFYEPKINDVAFFVDARRALPLLVAVARAAQAFGDAYVYAIKYVYQDRPMFCDSDLKVQRAHYELHQTLAPFREAKP